MRLFAVSTRFDWIFETMNSSTVRPMGPANRRGTPRIFDASMSHVPRISRRVAPGPSSTKRFWPVHLTA